MCPLHFAIFFLGVGRGGGGGPSRQWQGIPQRATHLYRTAQTQSYASLLRGVRALARKIRFKSLR